MRTKEELIELLKNNREDIASLKLRKIDLKKYKKELSDLEKTELENNMSTSYGINNDIHSKNIISDKVSKTIIKHEEKIAELKQKIKEIEKEIEILEEKVTEAEIRLNGLKYKEREILTAYYVDGRQALEIGKNLYYQLYGYSCSENGIYKIIKKGTEILLKL